jgi:DNA polymerase-3 subunit alpha
MEYKELEKLCMEKFEVVKDLVWRERLADELYFGKLVYDAGINLVDDLIKNKEKLDGRHIIPWILGLTNSYDLGKPLEFVQMKPGDSGGIDIDSDFEPEGKEKIKAYLEEKYGIERVLSVITYSTTGINSALRDICRKAGIEFTKVNLFCKEFDDELTWEENLEHLKETQFWSIYEENKEMFDKVPKLINKIRGQGVHAGGVIILDKPCWETLPVARVQDKVVAAFEESGAVTHLDSLGVIKYDILATKINSVFRDTLDIVFEKDENVFLVKDDDGIIKILKERDLPKELVEEFLKQH